jgi:NADPH-dependent ferric siderophore reductase
VSTRASQHVATVRRRDQLSTHLVRLTLDGLDDFVSTGAPDEWVGLVVPGQFQSRYYTVRSFAAGELVLDVVIHDLGLVTEWAARDDCVGDRVVVTDPKGSFSLTPEHAWLLLVGDLTALPAMARIVESTQVPTRIWAETPDDPADYLGPGRDGVDVAWSRPPEVGTSDLAAVVEQIEWPCGHGYFWMAGESAQMRAVRKHLMRDRELAGDDYDVMGYWRGGGARRQPRAVDPGPVWRAGKAAGKSDEQIWADYDAARGDA